MIKCLLLFLLLIQMFSSKQIENVNNTPNKTANYTYKDFVFPKRNDSLIRAWKLKQPIIHLNKTNITNSTL